jgi:3-hydroxyacyl-[acyl-carrier-protein] dehydratase
MLLLEQVVTLVPGTSCVARRRTRADDFFFQGHFPGAAVVPAVMLVEMIAQAGGLAAGAGADSDDRTLRLRVAALGPCKFPAAAGADQSLEVEARVVGRLGGMYKIEGRVTADGTVVASGAVTLADAGPR